MMCVHFRASKPIHKVATCKNTSFIEELCNKCALHYLISPASYHVNITLVYHTNYKLS